MGHSDSDSDSDSDKKYGKKEKKDKRDKKDKYDKDKYDKHDKDKHDKDKHDKDKHGKHDLHFQSGFPQQPLMPQFPPAPHGFQSLSPNPQHSGGSRDPNRPPSRTGRPPPSGYRVPLTSEAPFPPSQQSGGAPCFDADGQSPVYFGSALFPNSVHPCKVAPHLSPSCRVSYGGQERPHVGRYDLLPFTEDMVLVPARDGMIPYGKRPVEGGYEEDGAKLYHCIAVYNGVRVPGKAGEHLRGASIAFADREHQLSEYELLCWRD